MASLLCVGPFLSSLFSLWNILAFLFFLVVYILLDFYQKQRTIYKKIPPGPQPWPLIGSPIIPLSFFMSIGNRPHGTNAIVVDTVTDFAKAYGNIFSLFLGTKLLVVLNSFELAKDAFLNYPEVFSDRPDIPLVTMLTKRKGIAFAPYGPIWRKQRKFCHTSLRSFGLGKLSLEPSIRNMLAYIKSEILKLNEECGSAGMDLNPLIRNLSTNIICSLLFKQNYRHDDPDFRTINFLMQRQLRITGNSTAILMNILPLIYYLPFGVFKELRKVDREIFAFFMKIIKQHRDTLDPDNPRDLTDMYLMEMLAQRVAGENDTSFTEEYLFFIIGELFFAGSGTTTSSVLWYVINMMRHPDIQEKVQAEIDKVVGNERAPSMIDKINLPFTEATIMEVQRLHSVLPLAVPHMTTEQVDFRGYTIPKGTVVLSNLYSIHRDPNLWENPETFNPWRFLDSDGQLVRKECFIPFGIGRRVCMGEQLGKMALFLTITTLMQAFTFRVPEGQPPPSLLGLFGFGLKPALFSVCVTPRDSKSEAS